jgi:hypothetical protein
MGAADSFTSPSTGEVGAQRRVGVTPKTPL